MKTDYTLTPEYKEALLEHNYLHAIKWQEDIFYGSPIVSHPTFHQAQADRNEYFSLLLGVADRHDPTKNREPLIRTIRKIAARILFVLLLVGTLVGVML